MPPSGNRLLLLLALLAAAWASDAPGLGGADDGRAERDGEEPADEDGDEDEDEGGHEGSPDEGREGGPAQMTEDWWDVHYRKVFQDDWRVRGDPRGRGSLAPLRGLTDSQHFDATLACAEALVLGAPNASAREPAAVGGAGPPGRRPRILVLGCGLSSLVFALADRLDASVVCLELSEALVCKLEQVAVSVPRAPKFRVDDITAFAQRRRAQRSGRYGRVGGLPPHSFGLVIDENVIDGMACRFPPSASAASMRMALDGIRWLLQPGGRLLTVSFVPFDQPPYSAAFDGWGGRAGGPCRQSAGDGAHLKIWAVLPEAAAAAATCAAAR